MVYATHDYGVGFDNTKPFYLPEHEFGVVLKIGVTFNYHFFLFFKNKH